MVPLLLLYVVAARRKGSTFIIARDKGKEGFSSHLLSDHALCYRLFSIRRDVVVQYTGVHGCIHAPWNREHERGQCLRKERKKRGAEERGFVCLLPFTSFLGKKRREEEDHNGEEEAFSNDVTIDS